MGSAERQAGIKDQNGRYASTAVFDGRVQGVSWKKWKMQRLKDQERFTTLQNALTFSLHAQVIRGLPLRSSSTLTEIYSAFLKICMQT